MTARAPFRGGRRPDQVMRRMMQIWVVAVLAIVVGAGRQARAEVDVVSWGIQTFDQGDLRERYVQVAAGRFHNVALLNNGTVVAWGDNGYGQCSVPPGLAGVTQVAAGGILNLALVTFTDCNTNGQRDTYELLHGAPDTNANGTLDSCDMATGDLDLNGIIDTADLSLMLLDFGACPDCPDDFDGDGDVTTADIALLLLNFGPTG